MNIGSLTLNCEKYLHECNHCGFEADLYESEYECPVCRKGMMCRAAHAVAWIQDRGSSDAKLQAGYYGADSPLMVDGYLFTREV